MGFNQLMMRKFLSNNGELFEKMHSFIKEYSFQFRRKSTYEICLENEHCLIFFYTEKYEDTLITILTDKKTEKRYTYVDLFLAKGSPSSFLVRGTSEKDELMSKVLETISFFEAYASRELKGDFSLLTVA